MAKLAKEFIKGFYSFHDIIPNLDWRWFLNGISEAYPHIFRVFFYLIPFCSFLPTWACLARKSAGESTDPCGIAQGQLAIDEKVPFFLSQQI